MDAFSEIGYAAGIMKAGFSPLWNPSLSCGTPLFSQPGLALGYPGTLVMLLMPLMAGKIFFLGLHALLGFVGAWHFSKRYDLRLPAGAIAAMYSGAILVMGLTIAPALAVGFAWLPWPMLMRRTSGRFAAWAMLLSAGEPISASLSVLVILFSAKDQRRELWRSFAFGVAASLVVLAPTFQALFLTQPVSGKILGLSAYEAKKIKGDDREFRVFVDPHDATSSDSDAFGPTWVTGSRRPTRHIALEQASMPVLGQAREMWLNLWGVSEILGREGLGLNREQLHAPIRAAFVNSARLRDGSSNITELDAKPFLERPLLLDSATALDSKFASSAEGGLWTILSMQTNPLGESVISLPQKHDSGWLYLSDAAYPGWEARVDGKTRAIDRAEGAFRAVRIDFQDTQVQFLYRPWLFYGAWVISLMVLLLGIFRERPMPLR